MLLSLTRITMQISSLLLNLKREFGAATYSRFAIAKLVLIHWSGDSPGVCFAADTCMRMSQTIRFP